MRVHIDRAPSGLEIDWLRVWRRRAVQKAVAVDLHWRHRLERRTLDIGVFLASESNVWH